MNILVCVKRVPVTGGSIALRDDEQAIETRHLGFAISPHEECAVEEAVRLAEQHGGGSTVLTLGPPEAEEQLRDAMAIGIDRGILLEVSEEWDAQATAAALVAAIQAARTAGTEYDLILFGNESADTSNYHVGIRVGHALGRPCVTGVKKIEVVGERARLEQETLDGRDVYDVALPAVVTLKEGLNLPRYPSVPGRLRAKKKPIDRSAPDPRPAALERVRLTLPPGEGRQTEILGHGPQAAPAVVELLRQIGVG